MNLLLDTHIAIWFVTDDTQLSSSAKKAIEAPENRCYVSIASYWELAIKHSLGKLELHIGLNQLFELIEQSGIEILPITPAHVLAVATLPFHHRDPFDRLLIAQTISEKIVLISKDQVFAQYSVQLL